jgi:aryl-alcohol dehydrogenase-like predicted oxidoreductase
MVEIGLGTVQFGLQYGISNDGGVTSPQEVANILRYAENQGIRVLDTAALYGNSEKAIGEALPVDHSFKIVSKTPVFKKEIIDDEDVGHLRNVFKTSLARLQQRKIYALLFHHADDLLVQNSERLYKKALEWKEAGMVRKIGVSVYSETQIERIIKKYPIDIIQLPINVYDQRLIESGILKHLKDKNIEIHVRSVFLQGLMLMSFDKIPEYFQPVSNIFKAYQEYLIEKELTPTQGALAFLRQVSEIDVAILGVNKLSQLKSNISDFSNPECSLLKFDSFSVNQEKYVNPALWDF